MVSQQMKVKLRSVSLYILFNIFNKRYAFIWNLELQEEVLKDLQILQVEVKRAGRDVQGDTEDHEVMQEAAEEVVIDQHSVAGELGGDTGDVQADTEDHEVMQEAAEEVVMISIRTKKSSEATLETLNTEELGGDTGDVQGDAEDDEVMQEEV